LLAAENQTNIGVLDRTVIWQGQLTKMKAVRLIAALGLMAAAALTASPFYVANAMEAGIPDYVVTPLSGGDLELYLSILHASEDRFEHPTGDVSDAINAHKRFEPTKACAPDTETKTVLAW
jgi:hypothetical protein